MRDVRGGLEFRSGVVTPKAPVQFHVHGVGHWLSHCGENVGYVETATLGKVRLMPGEGMWVDATERHKLTAESGPWKYTCVGMEGL